MVSSGQTSHTEDDDISSESNGEEEPTTPLTPQSPNAPPADEVVVDINDGEGDGDQGDGEDEDEDEDEEEQENEDEEEEGSNNATPRSSMEGNRSDTGTPTPDSSDNTTDSSSSHGVEPEPNPNPNPPAENQSSILYNTTKKKGLLPVQVVLYQSAIKGDWKTAKSIFDVDSSAITMKITDGEDTPLHIAAAAKHISFVENLVKEYSSPSDLAIKNGNGDTALAFAAASGVVRIAKVMVDNNAELPNLYNANKPFPVLMAVAYKRKEMASFLLSKTHFQKLNNFEQIELLIAAISSDYYDIALDILTKKPELAKARMGLKETDGNWSENPEGETALHILSRKSDVIGSSSNLSFWRRHMNSRFKRFYKKAHMKTLAHQTVERIWNFVVKNLSKPDLYDFIRTPARLLHNAARAGNAEFLIILISSYPDLIWKVDEDDKSIFHIAVENRQESVFSLIYEIGGLRDFLANYHDHKKNSNMLHLAGKLAAPYNLSRVSGAALQMQRELLWFTEVEKIVVSSHLQMRTKIPLPPQAGIEENRFDELTPRELFTKAHKSLLKAGEEWMKNTANSCMLVATLIATVVFAAAFTVPGGNDDKSGTPNFRQNPAFTVFVISDVAALVLSTTSILTFLSILTSRYAEEDFLMSLPLKLLFGLVTLFLSISCMVVAFSATFFIAYDETKHKIPLGIAIVSIVPVGCFCLFHTKLVVDIFRSGYWAQFSLKKHKKRLF